MKFPLSLLHMFLKTDAPLARIAEVATAIGLEVDAIDDPAAALKPFVVAEVLHAEKHPQADKLQVCKVKAAQGELQIVCGAPNARAGIKVALANIGTVIPTNGMEIKAAKVRGIESQGMLCSADELGIGNDSAGIIELPYDAEIGASIVDVLGLNDPVIDLNITANRGDCMGVLGVARDLAAAGLGTLTLDIPPAPADTGETYPIRIEDTDGCPAFNGRILRGLSNGESPEWLQRMLTAAGMRPISFLVDATNFATLAYGRPAHVYDLKKLKGEIVVRRAQDGEPFAALNEKHYNLRSEDCVIADDSGVIGLGGIMGGSSTAVDETTTDILLEIALFNPERIAKTGRALHIDSDARARFERGVDRDALTVSDIGLSCFLLQFGGSAGKPELVGTPPAGPDPIAFDATAINALGGTDIPEARQKEILEQLSFVFDGERVTVPSWRHDVRQLADLAEEILRLHGYDHIAPVSLPKQQGVARPALNAAQLRVTQTRRALAARGLHEHYGWGFCSEAQAAAFGGQAEALALLNPISADLSVMRPSLLPHLLHAASMNHARGFSDIALFEVGAIFNDTSPTGQRTIAAGIRAGLRHGLHYASAPKADLFDVKADALAALAGAGFDASKTPVTRQAPGWYHPGRSGTLALGKNIIAHFGELHPTTLAALGCNFSVMAFEVHLDAIPQSRGQAKRKALVSSDYQPVTRDFAFVVDEAMPAAELIAAVTKAEKQLLQQVTMFDLYQGKGVPEGKKSLALTVTLQAADRTLTDQEIEKVAAAIVENAAKAGAVLR